MKTKNTLLKLKLDRNTKFFISVLFERPLGITLAENESIVGLEYTPETGDVVIHVTSPGEFNNVNVRIKDKAKRESMANLINFMNVGMDALPTKVASFETLTMRFLDAITSGELQIVPAFDEELINSLSDDAEIMAFGETLISQYNTDGVQCSRGALTRQIIELGEPRGLKIPYVYIAIVAENKIAFNQTITLDHNVLTRDYEGNLLDPIATGSIEFSTNGLVEVVNKTAESIDVRLADKHVYTYDLIGQKPRLQYRTEGLAK